MPINIKGKKYKTFAGATNAVAKSKGISKERAAAYVASVERKQNPTRRHSKKK